jgi:hypothetical protein
MYRWAMWPGANCFNFTRFLGFEIQTVFTGTTNFMTTPVPFWRNKFRKTYSKKRATLPYVRKLVWVSIMSVQRCKQVQ